MLDRRNDAVTRNERQLPRYLRGRVVSNFRGWKSEGMDLPLIHENGPYATNDETILRLIY